MRIDHARVVIRGRYELRERIGRDAATVTWLATDTVLARDVAVELVHPRLAEDPRFRSAFGAVTATLARCVHPSIARLLDAGEEDGVAFLVRQRPAGDRLDPNGQLDPADAVAAVSGVLHAFDGLHEAGTWQAALAPADVVRTPEGRGVLLADGIAAALIDSGQAMDDEELLRDREVAPEVRRGAPPDARSDVWIAGALLFRLLTGVDATADASPRTIRRDIPRPLDAIVRRALSSDPASRYPTPGSMADALGGSGPAGRLVELDREPPPHRSWFRTWVAVPLTVLVLAAAVVVVGLSFGELEIGGPVGIRLREASPPASAPTEHPLRIRSVSAFDPLGDGHETDDQAPLATDGNATTGWRTENYFDGKLFKPGVGLVLDLGGERTVTGFRLQTQAPGFSFEVLVGDDPQTLIGETSAAYAAPATRHALAPRTGRYVVVWITSVVPVSDGHRAEVDEIQVFGSG